MVSESSCARQWEKKTGKKSESESLSLQGYESIPQFHNSVIKRKNEEKWNMAGNIALSC